MGKKLLALALSLIIFSGCSQNIDQVTITPLRPDTSNYVLVGDADHQGGNSQPATSVSSVLNKQVLGGNVIRTSSSSPSFRMSSGIGVD